VHVVRSILPSVMNAAAHHASDVAIDWQQKLV